MSNNSKPNLKTVVKETGDKNSFNEIGVVRVNSMGGFTTYS